MTETRFECFTVAVGLPQADLRGPRGSCHQDAKSRLCFPYM